MNGPAHVVKQLRLPNWKLLSRKSQQFSKNGKLQKQKYSKEMRLS